MEEFKNLLETGGLVKYTITKNKIKKNKTEIEFNFVTLGEKSYLIKSTLFIKRRDLVINEEDKFIVKFFKETKTLTDLYSFVESYDNPCNKKGVDNEK